MLKICGLLCLCSELFWPCGASKLLRLKVTCVLLSLEQSRIFFAETIKDANFLF